MPNRGLLLPALALLIAALLGACVGSANDETERLKLPSVPAARFFYGFFWPPAFTEDEVDLLFEPSSNASTAPVYRLVFPYVDKAYARSMSKKFGLQGDPERIRPPEPFTDMSVPMPPFYLPGYEVEEGPLRVEVRLGDGSVSYRNSSSVEPSPGPSVSITAERAGLAAEAFLRDHDLLPENAELGRVTVDEYGGALVSFWDGRLGEAFYGPYIGAEIDATEQVHTVHYSWPDPVRIGEYPVVSEIEAFNRLFEGMSSIIQGVTSDPPRIELSSIEMRYEVAWEGDDMAPTSPLYMVPFYRFNLIDHGFIQVPALTEEYLFPPGFQWPPEDAG